MKLRINTTIFCLVLMAYVQGSVSRIIKCWQDKVIGGQTLEEVYCPGSCFTLEKSFEITYRACSPKYVRTGCDLAKQGIKCWCNFDLCNSPDYRMIRNNSDERIRKSKTITEMDFNIDGDSYKNP